MMKRQLTTECENLFGILCSREPSVQMPATIYKQLADYHGMHVQDLLGSFHRANDETPAGRRQLTDNEKPLAFCAPVASHHNRLADYYVVEKFHAGVRFALKPSLASRNWIMQRNCMELARSSHPPPS
jgi:hypothetical protein